jgi:hypothetical protein
MNLTAGIKKFPNLTRTRLFAEDITDDDIKEICDKTGISIDDEQGFDKYLIIDLLAFGLTPAHFLLMFSNCITREEDKIILLEKIMSDEDNINQVLFEVLREYKDLVQIVLNNKKVFNYSLEEIDSLMKQLLEAPKA